MARFDLAMIHQVIRIGRWVVDFIFAVDKYDDEGVLSCLYDIDAPYDIMLRANRIMESGRMNRGFTFGNPMLKRAVVVVGPTTSGKQFINTFSHEIDHLSDIIASSLGIKNEREGTSYITGDTTMALAEILCKLGCDHCREVK